jgi:hypothetical protein
MIFLEPFNANCETRYDTGNLREKGAVQMVKMQDMFESMPACRAIATLALPAILSQLVTMVYNLADIFFVGQLGDPNMVAAVSLGFPADSSAIISCIPEKRTSAHYDFRIFYFKTSGRIVRSPFPGSNDQSIDERLVSFRRNCRCRITCTFQNC